MGGMPPMGGQPMGGFGQPQMGMPQQQMPYGQPGMAPQAAPNPGPDVTMGAAANGVNPFAIDSSSPAMNAAKATTDNKQFSL